MKSWLLVSAMFLTALGSGQTILKDSKAERYAAFWKGVGGGYKGTWQAAAKLKAGQPVDDLQASLLAAAYFYAHVSGCGGAGEPIDKGTYWLFRSAWGAAGRPGPEIRVDKMTGATSSKGRITVKDPASYSRFYAK